nr:hypothetical protein CFP56_71268 [Quercus suber]
MAIVHVDARTHCRRILSLFLLYPSHMPVPGFSRNKRNQRLQVCPDARSLARPFLADVLAGLEFERKLTWHNTFGSCIASTFGSFSQPPTSMFPTRCYSFPHLHAAVAIHFASSFRALHFFCPQRSHFLSQQDCNSDLTHAVLRTQSFQPTPHPSQLADPARSFLPTLHPSPEDLLSQWSISLPRARAELLPCLAILDHVLPFWSLVSDNYARTDAFCGSPVTCTDSHAAQQSYPATIPEAEKNAVTPRSLPQ